ncbi:response regulator [Planosporangium mesophilum]|nr:response regulator transcription factor [Planosporangium mesophilum]NJC82654.1 response regulator transcription factor [Planosporangium mesophilum]
MAPSDMAPSDIAVLVVDDHALFTEALRARLTQEPDLGPVSVAYGAREAAERVAVTHPDVVVLDVVLDDGSGIDVLDHLREASPTSRVVMLTAVESVDDVVAALTRGARAWLPKTVDTGHLVRVIRGVNRGEAWLAPDLLGRVLADLAARTTTRRSTPLAGLSPREREVLQFMVDGLSRTEIAARLGVSGNTVRTHLQHLIAKLGVHSTLECVAVALRNGLRASDALN